MLKTIKARIRFLCLDKINIDNICFLKNPTMGSFLFSKFNNIL